MTDKSAYRVRLLQDAPRHFAQVALWHHQECERQGLVSTLATRQQRLLSHVQPESVPKTIIITQGRHLLGCVSLVDYSYRADSSVPIPRTQTPLWLSNLFVPDSYRQQGIGNLLIEAAKKYANELGFSELFLSAAEYTDYYEKRGWEITRRTRLGGRQVNVMRVAI